MMLSGTHGAQSGDSARLERLAQASMAMLDPMLDPRLRQHPPELAAQISLRLVACARAADEAGIRSIEYLSSLLLPYLRRAAAGPRWDEASARIQDWITDVIIFCAGHCDAREARELLLIINAWPDFAPVPEHFVALIAARLGQDALRLQALTRASGAVSVSPQPPVAGEQGPTDRDDAQSGDAQSDDAQSDDAPTGAPAWCRIDVPAAPCEAARDEFDLLAQALAAFEDDVLGALRLSLDAADQGARSRAADLACQRLGHFANAVGYIGLAPMAASLEMAAQCFARWRTEPQALNVAVADALARLAQALLVYLRQPSVGSARAFVSVLGAEPWSMRVDAASVQAVAGWLGEVSLVGSRQVVARASDFDEAELSLEIAPDADARVIDHLLRELPALSAQLARSIELAMGGSLDDLAAAQRLAHTLKGTAHTAGIRGIATLTHQMEDLLHLLARTGRAPPPALHEPLAQAADCVAEMTEAVAGLGPAPEGALAVCRATARWIERIVNEGVPQDDPVSPVAPAAPTGPASPEPASTGPAPAAAASAQAGVSGEAMAFEELLRVPARSLDQMLDLAAEASMLLAQVQEQLSGLDETRGAMGAGSERLQGLSHDLERLVDTNAFALQAPRREGGLDALELDEFTELHTVARRIAESGADGKLLGQRLDRHARALTDSVARLERVQADLREAAMRSRMVAVATIVPRLQRAVRQASRMAGRLADLEVDGGQTLVDAQLLQMLIDPLTHLLRNAVDHGIEAAEVRAGAGKPTVGRVRLVFTREDRQLKIACEDDGSGLDLERIRAIAIEQRMFEPAAAALARREDLIGLVLRPGFSTRRSVTQLSGRGIGLDVVARAVARLRGTLDIGFEAGAGTRIVLALPERLALEPVTIARSPTHVLALSVRGVEQILPADGVSVDDAGRDRFVSTNGFLPVKRLDEAIGLAPGAFASARVGHRSPFDDGAMRGPTGDAVLLVRLDDGELCALLAPDLSQMRTVVLRPLPAWLPRADWIDGAAVLGDGASVPVIDLPRLLSARNAVPLELAGPEEPAVGALRCLVVDDSVSVRQSMEGFLRDLGFEVDCAGDGMQALACVAHEVPALAIIDLEMPRMNGLELAAALRRETGTRALPLIMITSRQSEKHRALALEAGVDAFLTKPYTEDELAHAIRCCLGVHVLQPERGG